MNNESKRPSAGAEAREEVVPTITATAGDCQVDVQAGVEPRYWYHQLLGFERMPGSAKIQLRRLDLNVIVAGQTLTFRLCNVKIEGETVPETRD